MEVDLKVYKGHLEMHRMRRPGNLEGYTVTLMATGTKAETDLLWEKLKTLYSNIQHVRDFKNLSDEKTESK